MKKLGFGAMRMPLLDKKDPKSIDIEQVKAMVDTFMERGFTYFDTAHPYHQNCSERALKTALVDRYPRNDYILADKLPIHMMPAGATYEEVFEGQIKDCGVEYFDYYLLHNISEALYNQRGDEMFAFARTRQKEGRARRIGFSFHDRPEVLQRILSEHPEVEFVQLQLNYLDWDSANVQARRCYEIATEHKKPVVVMEPLKGGNLVNLTDDVGSIFKAVNPGASYASWGIRYAASLENVFMVLSGMNSLQQLQDNTATMQQFVPLSDEERQAVDKVAEKLQELIPIPCTACQYCVDDCPKNINIPAYFAIYNSMKSQPIGFYPMYYDRQSYGRGKASECIQCGVCEGHCPQHIAITEFLPLIAETFESPAK